LESSKVSALEKMSEVHKRLAISIEASNELESLRTDYMILKNMGDMVRCAGVLTELRAMRNPSSPSPTTVTAETSPTNASSTAAPDTAIKVAADPPMAFVETVENPPRVDHLDLVVRLTPSMNGNQEFTAPRSLVSQAGPSHWDVCSC
jgi:hypothetical protein